MCLGLFSIILERSYHVTPEHIVEALLENDEVDINDFMRGHQIVPLPQCFKMNGWGIYFVPFRRKGDQVTGAMVYPKGRQAWSSQTELNLVTINTDNGKWQHCELPAMDLSVEIRLDSMRRALPESDEVDINDFMRDHDVLAAQKGQWFRADKRALGKLSVEFVCVGKQVARTSQHGILLSCLFVRLFSGREPLVGWTGLRQKTLEQDYQPCAKPAFTADVEAEIKRLWELDFPEDKKRTRLLIGPNGVRFVEENEEPDINDFMRDHEVEMPSHMPIKDIEELKVGDKIWVYTKQFNATNPAVVVGLDPTGLNRALRYVQFRRGQDDNNSFVIWQHELENDYDRVYRRFPGVPPHTPGVKGRPTDES
jgi:hypothetical protein